MYGLHLFERFVIFGNGSNLFCVKHSFKWVCITPILQVAVTGSIFKTQTVAKAKTLHNQRCWADAVEACNKVAKEQYALWCMALIVSLEYPCPELFNES